MIYNIDSNLDYSGFYILYRVGAINEIKGLRGASHFLEHLICHNLDHLLDEFSFYRIDSNAFTTNNFVGFMYQGIEKYLAPYRGEIIDKIVNGGLDETKFENEKNIIIQEYKQYFIDKLDSNILNSERLYFNFYGALGELEDLENLTYEMCLEHYNKYFINPLIVNIAKEKYTHFNYNQITTREEYDAIINSYHETCFKPVFNIDKYDVKVENISSDNNVGVAFISKESEKIALLGFITNILNTGLTSPLYKELRENNGLVYSVSSSYDTVGNKAIFSINTTTTEDNVEKVKKLITNIMSEPSKYVSEEWFNTIKSSIKISGEVKEIFRYKDFGYFINSSDKLPINILKTITYEDVLNNIKELFNTGVFYCN